MAVNSVSAYRVCSTNYVRPHNGYGSTLRDGGRWNSSKYACIYSGGNRSIAQLEWVSHFLINAVDFPKLTIITYAIPESSIISVDLSKHPNWIDDEILTKGLGDKFLAEKEFLALKVPSTMDTKEFNYIINANHPDFSEEENVINDIEVLTLNKRFFEVKEFVKAALKASLPAKLRVNAKLLKYTIDPGPGPIPRTHRTGRHKR
ncbi:MAG TPA: RES family NAD+ phosphorylase [Mucilaginibacter sp.]|jgi:RES domain-containing protein